MSKEPQVGSDGFHSGFYLCEGIYLDEIQQKLIDERNNEKELDITKIEDKITIFEREVHAWLFHPMAKLLKEDFDENKKYLPFQNAFFILFGIFAYIEKIELYRQGIVNKESEISKDKISRLDKIKQILCSICSDTTDEKIQSAKFLTDGFKRIFKDITGARINKILNHTRNSLMHEAMVGDKVLLNYDFEKAVEYDGSGTKIKVIKINPYKICEEIIEDFNKYIEDLNEVKNETLLKNFEVKFNEVYKDEISKLTQSVV